MEVEDPYGFTATFGPATLATERNERKNYCAVHWRGIGHATGAVMNCPFGAGPMRSIATRVVGKGRVVREGKPEALRSAAEAD